MIDASAVIDLILDRPPHAVAIAVRIKQAKSMLYAPYLIDAEVGQVLRRWVLRGEISSDRAQAAIEDYWDLPIHRYPHRPLFKRAFALRDNASIYDAIYIALAEGLRAPLLTRDQAFLATIPNLRIRVELIENTVSSE